MKFEILNRFSGEVQITTEIECAVDTIPSVKLGLAVKWAVKENADLRSADLRSADLRSADLRSADLRSADLRSADLRSADLRSADLRSANLYGADLRSADLRSANLYGADLRSADLNKAKNAELPIAQTRVLPEGSLIGWKKCSYGVIVKLRIPEEAKRSHAFGRKCRAEFADVVEVIGGEVGISMHDNKTAYHVGQRVTPDTFDENWMEECAPGIHFFITRIEAENY
ncbi:pentapeptide repeat-containing protein [Rhizobium laguerreae]|uniref:pentapeptide repeat-containing protein n=1 Tax=Rhizobium laguerreae TaxID=1076926 RepID=UPI001C907934|nr:pentapeptide repeat-containing protein [Rhizobium laguerreae]